MALTKLAACEQDRVFQRQVISHSSFVLKQHESRTIAVNSRKKTRSKILAEREDFLTCRYIACNPCTLVEALSEDSYERVQDEAIKRLKISKKQKILTNRIK